MINNTRRFVSINNLLLLLLVLSSLLLPGSIKQAYTETSEGTETVQAKTTRALVKRLRKYHYLEEPFDDTFSEKVYDNYIKMLDPARTHFLASDIQEFSKYRHSFDEDLKDGNLQNAFFIYRDWITHWNYWIKVLTLLIFKRKNIWNWTAKIFPG